jgi:hypothetical protein
MCPNGRFNINIKMEQDSNKQIYLVDRIMDVCDWKLQASLLLVKEQSASQIQLS